MNEYGELVEVVERVLGPVKRRVVREEWFNDLLETTATVPRFEHLTVRGTVGRRRLCRLSTNLGHVDAHAHARTPLDTGRSWYQDSR
jgi:hypothetical protein